MFNEKHLCPNCQVSYDETIHLPRKLPNCQHSLCTSCIKKLITSKNDFTCPLDSTTSKNIYSLKDFKIDNFLIDETRYHPSNKNISISKSLNINEPRKINTFINTYNNKTRNATSPIPTNNCYQKKTISVKKTTFNFFNHIPLCRIHSLPLNIICRDDAEKICSQCALDNKHLNHKIITEIDFNNYLSDLVKIYNDLENHEKLNLIRDFENKRLIFTKLEKKFMEYKTEIQNIKKEIKKNLDIQCQKLLNFLQLRKNEIFLKYQFTKYDTNSLKDSTSNWIKSVKEKLSEADCGTLEEPNINSLKLLDKNPNKDIFNLVNSGQQIDERYSFIKETESIISQLELFLSNGISLTNNFNEINNLINTQFINSSGTNNSKDIENKYLFTLSENRELIESLKLSNFSSFFNENKNVILDIESELDNENSINNNIITNRINEYNKHKLIFSEDFTKKKIKINFHRKLIEGGRSTHNYSNSLQNNNITNDNNLLNGTFNYNTTLIENDNNENYNIRDSTNDRNRLIIKNEDIISPIQKKENFSKHSTQNNFSFNENEKTEEKKTIKKIIVKFINKKNSSTFIKKNALNYNQPTFPNPTVSSDLFHQYKNSYTEPSKNLFSKDKKNNSNIHFLKKYQSTEKMKVKVKNLVNGAQINNNSNTQNVQSNSKEKLTRCISLENKLLIQKCRKNFPSKIILPPPNTDRIKNTNTISNFNNNINNHIYYYTNNNKTDTYNVNYNNSSTYYKIDKRTLIKTLSNENLEKYVIYQLKKYKPNFNRINMNGIGIKILCVHLIKNKRKKYYELKLQGSNLYDNDFNMVTNCLINNKISIATLNFGENNLSDDCYNYIIELIKKYEDVKSLILTNNLLGKPTKEKIKKFCKTNLNSLGSINIYL